MDIDIQGLSGIAHERYEPRGILHSEMAFIVALCRKHCVEVVIESGRARGQSTFILGKYLPDVKMFSIDKASDDEAFAAERLAGFANVSLHRGDAASVMPEIVAAHRGKRIALLLDGPKGLQAISLLKRCVEAFDGVVLGFIHDMRKLDHGAPSPFRAAAEREFPLAIFSDDEDYVALSSFMDEGLEGTWSGWMPYMSSKPGNPAFEYIESYGPTVGAFPFA